MIPFHRTGVNESKRADPTERQAGLPRVIYLTNRRQMHTLAAMKAPVLEHGVRLDIRPYDWLFTAPKLPFAAYIFTDFDRLHPWYLEQLGKIWQVLGAAGLPTLNDPRQWLPRPAFIRTLQAAGINQFGCWLPAHGERPDRFPCFLRTIASHRGTESDLLNSTEEADAALGAAMDQGIGIADLMFVEFAGALVPGTSHYRKDAAYRVGDRIIRALSVNDGDWLAKSGQSGLAGAAYYAEELAEQRDYPHEETMMAAFKAAGLEFGRADFSFVDGRMQIYEINSNPHVAFDFDHPFEDRGQTQREQRAALAAALADLAPMGDPCEADISALIPERGWDRVTLKQP